MSNTLNAKFKDLHGAFPTSIVTLAFWLMCMRELHIICTTELQLLDFVSGTNQLQMVVIYSGYLVHFCGQPHCASLNTGYICRGIGYAYPDATYVDSYTILVVNVKRKRLVLWHVHQNASFYLICWCSWYHSKSHVYTTCNSCI